MSIIYIDGFEWAADSEFAFGGVGRWSTGALLASWFQTTTNTRGGIGKAITMDSSGHIIHGIGNVTTGFCGFAYKTITLPSVNDQICYLLEGTASQGYHLRLEVGPTGFFRVLKGNTLLETGVNFQLGNDEWVWLEFKWTIDNSSGAFELRINGSETPELDFSGDTQNAGLSFVEAIQLQGNTDDPHWDDFYIADDADSQDWLGDVSVETLVADGAGAASDFTPSAGSNHENIEELPTDNDSTYNESSTLDDDDRFSHDDLSADTEDVICVQVGIFARKDDAGAREMRVLAEDGTTEGEGAAHALAETFAWYVDMFEDHPTGAAVWTEAEVNDGEYGYTIEV